MKSSRILILALVVFAGACGTDEATPTTTVATTTAATVAPVTQTGTQQGGMATSDMRDRHQATIPAPFSGLTNPVTADEASLERGADIYATCAVCHGETGLGDGAAGAALDPVPVNIAHTSQMMSDAYFFWRISEGGAEWFTAMPAWQDALDEQDIWDVINYVQALGEGTATGQGMGQGQGMGMGPGANTQAQAVQQAALLEIAVDQGIITQAEADVFDAAHATVDAKVAELRATGITGIAVLLPTTLADLVASGDLTQDEADTFQSVRDRMSEAGLLP